MQDLFLVEPEAINRIDALIKLTGKPYFRIEVINGGCSGYKYNFSMESVEREDDIIIQPESDMVVLVDDMSLGFLRGSTISYRDEVDWSGFEVSNPSQKKCRCGFSVEGE